MPPGSLVRKSEPRVGSQSASDLRKEFMHRKRPRKAPVVLREKQGLTWVRRLAPPPASGLKRRFALVGIYALTVVIVSLINVLIIWFAAWVIRGVPLLSGSGLMVFVPAVGSAVWILLYALD